MSLDTAASPSAPCLLVFAARERAKAFVRGAFPKRKARTLLVRTREEFDHAIRRDLIDAVLIDLGAGNGAGHAEAGAQSASLSSVSTHPSPVPVRPAPPGGRPAGAAAVPSEEAWDILARAQDFPSTPFFALLPTRTADTPAIARAAHMGATDILAEGMDEEAARDLVFPHTYTARFARALHDPPAALGLTADIQRRTWHCIIQHAGRPVTTKALADEIGVTREHLSRNFAQGNGPNLKRIIDLVRLVSAAELSKNPGYDVRDVAEVLGFASSSHLAVTTHRIASTRPASLAGLRTVDLVDRFTQGRTRSRVAGNEGL